MAGEDLRPSEEPGVRRRLARIGGPLAFRLGLGFTRQGRFIDGDVRSPQDHAVGRNDVPLTQHQQVARDNLLNGHGHYMFLSDHIGKGRGRAGQLVQGGSGTRLEHDVDAQHGNERKREHDGVPRFAQQEVDRGSNGQHDCHRIEQEADRLLDPRQAVALHPSIRSDLCESAARLK